MGADDRRLATGSGRAVPPCHGCVLGELAKGADNLVEADDFAHDPS